ncbi:MAG: 2-iminoacetate synthase ThiH [Desulfuromonadales bacterium]|nr:2-iminoacetate synthase ThiH [Desulfuromonadales bacterium]
MTFMNEINSYDSAELLQQIEAKTSSDVLRALSVERPDIEAFKALLSPAAEHYLEAMAAKAHRITQQRFGRTILLYAPLYISNECTNGCVYCGFNATNKVPRRTLTLDEVEREARILYDQGFRHILLVTGEAPKKVDDAYLAAVVRRIRSLFSSISIEVYPMSADGYQLMVDAGVDGLTIYQETYDRALYSELHPFGQKRDYDFRLETPARGGAAGLRRIGIGFLQGLGNFRTEAFFTGLHARYLSKQFWRSLISISFPRMRPAQGVFPPPYPVSDTHLVQLICAMRLLMHDAGLVMSTRESATMRDNLLPLGITQMSAGSCTAPGGYTDLDEGTEQFTIDDDRSPAEMAEVLRRFGYDPVWKDWDASFLDTSAG